MGSEPSEKHVMPLPLFLSSFNHSYKLFGHPASALRMELATPGTPVDKKMPKFLFLRKPVQTRVKEFRACQSPIFLRISDHLHFCLESLNSHPGHFQ